MKAMPVFDSHGDFVAAVCIVRDVTTTFKDVSLDEAEPAELLSHSDAAASEHVPATAGIDRSSSR